MGNCKKMVYLCIRNTESLTMRDYFIKTRQTDGDTTLYTRIRKKFPSVDINVNTRIKVDIATFRGIEEEKKRKGNKTALEAWLKASPKRKALQAQLVDLDKALTALAETSNYNVEYIKSNIDDVVNRIVFPMEYKAEQERIKAEKEEQERIKAEKEREEQARIKAEEEMRKDVVLYLEQFIDGIKKGTRSFKNNAYTSGTIVVWNSFHRLMKQFYRRHKFTWDDVDKTMVAKFTAWLREEGYMPSTINKYIVCFRAMVGYSYEDGYHNNQRAQLAFQRVKYTVDDKAKEIYLTADELQALYDMPLDGTRAVYRDVFLVGCYTCQRFSDYSRIEKGSVRVTERGTRVIEITQVKTGTKVYVPILDDKLEQLLAKYDYNVPKVSDVVLNRYIKEILCDLSITVPSLAKTERTVLTMMERDQEQRGDKAFMRDEKGMVIKPRWAMVSTHTARRTGITLLYQSKLFDIVQMMHVSGHKTPSIFLEYIKLSGKEVADEMADAVKKSNVNPF